MSYHPISRINRVKDLRRILTDRWGPRLPNDETGRRLLAIVADHAMLIARDLAVKMVTQLAPPEISDAEIYFVIDRAGDGRMWGPHVLPKAIDLTEDERVRLQVRTIMATDCTPAERKKRRTLAVGGGAGSARHSASSQPSALPLLAPLVPFFYPRHSLLRQIYIPKLFTNDDEVPRGLPECE